MNPVGLVLVKIRIDARPVFGLQAGFGQPTLTSFPGNGLQNPTSGRGAPDAVALFAMPARQIDGASQPIDIVVYQQTADALFESSFTGPTGLGAPVDLTTPDRASGRSFRRMALSTWELSGVDGDGIAATPNSCVQIDGN